MAHQTQSVIANSTLKSFQRPPTILAEETFLPRGRVTFRDITTITAKSAGDTKQFQYILKLPLNYGYVVEFLSLAVAFSSQADADNYNEFGQANLQFSNPGVVNDARVFVRSAGSAGSPTSVSKIWTYASHMCEPFPAAVSPTRMILNVYDTDGTNATGAATSELFATFLQYDIRQLDDVRVNAPAPVRMCG